MELNKDNPQERLYGWFAGIIDGEGTISLQKMKSRKLGMFRLVPYICIVNTDVCIMNKCSEILEFMGIKHRTYLRELGINKPVYQMRIDGIKASTKLLTEIRKYLIGKKIQADYILEYIKQRIPYTDYTDKDLSYYENIKKMHHEVSSETLRRIGTVEPKDKVRPLQ